MQSPASNNPPNRRQIVRGAAWSVPAVLSAGVVPAYASSKRERPLRLPVSISELWRAKL